MNKVKVNQEFEFELAEASKMDVLDMGSNVFHLIENHQSYEVELLNVDKRNKVVSLLLNGQKYECQINDSLDLLLEKMGMGAGATSKINEIKAPMPGLVLDIKVAPGDELSKGDGVLVLEAMKMENLIKSPGDGVVKSIAVKKGEAVEKNQVLIRLE